MVGLHEAKGDPLEKENEIKNKSLRFTAYKQYVWWIYQRLGKGNRRVLPSKLNNITQKQIDSMFQIMKAKKIDKDNIYTYITNLTLMKIIRVYLVLNLKICFSIICSFSGLVMVPCFWMCEFMKLRAACPFMFIFYMEENDAPFFS